MFPAIMGGIMMIFLTKFMTGGQDAYADAGKIAEQALGGIKTVYAFSLQRRFQAKYDVLLDKAKVVSVYNAFFWREKMTRCRSTRRPE